METGPRGPFLFRVNGKTQDMQKNACQNEPSCHPSTIVELVSSLTVEQYRNLHHFAERRLQRLRTHGGSGRLLAGCSADDLIHTVIAKFLLGERHPKKGRHLPERHRQSTTVFLRALMGAVNSELSNLVSSSEAVAPHLPVADAGHESTAVEVAISDDHNKLLQRRDLHRELFRRLRAAATPSQRDIICAWEASDLAGDNPSLEQFDRRRVHEVRQLAQHILQELAVEVSPGAQGIEMVM